MTFNLNNRQKIIIFSGVIFLALGLGLFFIIRQKYSPPSLNNLPSDKQNNQVTAPQDPTVKNLPDKITGFHFEPLTQNKCDALQGAEKDDCLDYLKTDQAILDNNYKVCQEIKNDDIQYYCLMKFVNLNERNNLKFCDYFTSEENKDKCLNNFAFTLQDSTICPEGGEELEKQECAARINALRGAANGDIEECKKIHSLEYSNLCIERLINNFNRDCRLFKKQVDQIACQDIVLYEDAMESKNVNLCSLITDDTRKKVCVNILTKGDNVDSDNDYITDGKELWFNTNPFNPDTDGDGQIDGQELYTEHNPIDALE